jgi:8-oxo-dGTP pyrophosphatase MutT (NUDIX family)
VVVVWGDPIVPHAGGGEAGEAPYPARMAEHHITGGTGDTPLIDAATVVLLRDTAAGVECLMVRKTSGQAFGGLWVFPGGRVEDADGTGFEGARRGAVREAAEETGLVVDAEALVPLSHWTPPTTAPRRYATWFFVAALPEGAADVEVDGGEIGDHVWTAPADAIARHASGEIEIIPPTWVTLQRVADLAACGTAAATVDAAAAEEADRYFTRMARQGDALVTLWQGDAGYASGDADAPGARHRLVMDPAGWRYERSR